MTDALYTFKGIAKGPYYYRTVFISAASPTTLFSGLTGELYHFIGISVEPTGTTSSDNYIIDTLDITDNGTTLNLLSGNEIFYVRNNNYLDLTWKDTFVPIDYRNTGAGAITVEMEMGGSTGAQRITLIYTKLN